MRHGLLSSLLGLTLLAAGPVSAQTGSPADPDTQKRILLSSDLIEVLNLRPLLAQLAPGAARNMIAAIQQSTGKPVPEAQQKTVAEVVHRKMAERLPDVIPVLAPVTADAFTAAELQALLDFYKSPQGQAILNKLPGYQAQSGRLLQAWMQAHLPTIERSIVEDLKTKGVNIPAPQQQSQQQAPQQQSQQQPKR